MSYVNNKPHKYKKVRIQVELRQNQRFYYGRLPTPDSPDIVIPGQVRGIFEDDLVVIKIKRKRLDDYSKYFGSIKGMHCVLLTFSNHFGKVTFYQFVKCLLYSVYSLVMCHTFWYRNYLNAWLLLKNFLALTVKLTTVIRDTRKIVPMDQKSKWSHYRSMHILFFFLHLHLHLNFLLFQLIF